MKRPNASSLILFGFSLGLFASANASMLGSAVFPDVPNGAYFDDAVGDMYSAGIITGYQNGKFGPNDYVTRGQVAVMMQRLKANLTGQSLVTSSSSSSRSRTSSSSVSSASSVSSESSSVSPTNTTQGSFRFTTGSFKADENEGEHTINVIRYGGNAGIVTVDYELEAGTATEGSDYEIVSGTLTFGDGKTTATFTVPILDDNETEDNETVYLKLVNHSGGGSVGSPDTATLTIVDNDEGNGTAADPENTNGVFIFSASEYGVAEDMGSVIITVNRTSGSTGATSVKMETANGTADNSYYTDADTVLSFADGETSKTVTVTVKDNNNTNGNKTVNLKLISPTGGAALGSLSTSTLVIVDNEVAEFGNGSFRLDDDTYTAHEGDPLVVTIDRRGGAKGEVTVDYATQNALAKSDEDYTAVSGTLTFKEGETKKTILVPVLKDTKNDPNETFRFKLSNATGSASIDTPFEAVVTIQ